MEVFRLKLRLENINKTFFNNEQLNEVLKDISFEVQDGEFVSLLGPSGCGKTTLLTIVAGFKEATDGKVFVGDSQVKEPGPDRGFVFQNYALFPWMTIRENIIFPMKEMKYSKEVRNKRADDLLELAQLSDKGDLYPEQLSGGMKQRTALVRALANEPQVLLMDEPLGALDYQMRKSLQAELEDIWLKNRTTVLMVTHDVDESVYLSDRIIVLSTDKGKIVENIKIDLERPRNRSDREYKNYIDKLTTCLSQFKG